jgi:environmental stress-induced protein Ves
LRVQIIRRSTFRTTPWKNGGGVTHEALRVPADGATFRWRVSVATIGASGPFSDFSGFRRYMALLGGAGLELRFADGTAASLREVGALLAFDGGQAAHCELLAGECTDLNLIVAAALPPPRVRVLGLTSVLSVDAAAQESVLVFAVAGAVVVARAGGARETLAPWDLALATAAEDGAVRLSPADELSPVQVLVANLRDTG